MFNKPIVLVVLNFIEERKQTVDQLCSVLLIENGEKKKKT